MNDSPYGQKGLAEKSRSYETHVVGIRMIVKAHLHDHTVVHELGIVVQITVVGNMKDAAISLNTFRHVGNCADLLEKQST